MPLTIGTKRALLARGGGIPTMEFDLNAITFSEAMAIRADPSGLWDGAVMVQGPWQDEAGSGDRLRTPATASVGNPTDAGTRNLLDYRQGTVEFIATCEDDWNNGENGIIAEHSGSRFRIQKITAGRLYFFLGTTLLVNLDTSACVAGTPYHIVISWDTENTIDGTNYGRGSLEDAHTYYSSSGGAKSFASSLMDIGGGDTSLSNMIIAGFKIWDFVWYDGTYGNAGASMGVDLVAAHAAGENVAKYIAAYGCKFGLPTTATPGQLTTTGQAYSMPATLLEQGDLWDGGYLGGPYMVYFDGTDDEVNFGSDASLDDIPSGASITVEGWFRIDTDQAVHLIGKGSRETLVGWTLRVDSSGRLLVYIDCDTTAAFATISYHKYAGLSAFSDGKCHHFCMVYDDTGDRIPYCAVDGRWPSSYDGQGAGVGAYTTDASYSLSTGEDNLSHRDLLGAHGWLRLSNTRRYTPGTNFIPPTDLPAADGNTIEQWDVAQGTGNLTATVNSPANDGVRTGATWIPVWDQSGTPVLSQCLKFEQQNDGINHGSGANIDNLFLADCTIEIYALIPSASAAKNVVFISKADNAITAGWYLQKTSANALIFKAEFGGTDIDISIAGAAIADQQWHQYAVDWDVGTLTARVLKDGIVIGTGTAVGAYQADAALDLLVNGRQAIGSSDSLVVVGWIALSNSRRYSGAGDCHVIPDRHNCPPNDANYQLLCDMKDGAGTTVTDYSGNAYHGTVTFGATTRWINDQDIETIAPGHQIYNGRGVVFGSDGANDGLVHLHTVTAGDDLVIRAIAATGNDSRGQWQLRVRDEIGAADIVTVKFPSMHGTHTGANNAANLTDSNARWLNNQIGTGWKAYNITDGSVATLGANPCDGAGTTLTTTLAGGAENDWDTGDEYRLIPPRSYREHPMVLQFCCKAPVGCTQIGLYVEETSGEGTLYLHRVDLHENVAQNGDMESLQGVNPELPTGWLPSGLGAGETVAEAAIVHSGAQSLEFTAGATENEKMQSNNAFTPAGVFYAMMMWGYDAGTSTPQLSLGNSDADGVLETGSFTKQAMTGAFWAFIGSVWRTILDNRRGMIWGAASAGYVDDYAGIALDAVTLTVTPASEANSLESGGLRIDGYDRAPQPVVAGEIGATWGDIRWQTGPRHGDTEFPLFGNGTPYFWRLQGDANNYIEVLVSAADTIMVRFNANGAGAVNNTWATGGAFFTPDTQHLFRLRWTAAQMQLYVDGTVRVTVVAPTGFVWPFPLALWWGSDQLGAQQIDAVFAAP